MKNHLKDIQDKATQADNSYTSDEAERDFEDAYLKTYMKDVQLSVKISQPFTRDPFLFYLIHKRIDESLLIGSEVPSST